MTDDCRARGLELEAGLGTERQSELLLAALFACERLPNKDDEERSYNEETSDHAAERTHHVR